MRVVWRSPIWVTLGMAAMCAQAAFPQAARNAQQDEAERAIRTVLHDTTVATFNGDAATFIAHSARRTLGLYDLVFELLTEKPGAKAQLAKAGIKKGADFLAVSLKSAAAAAPKEDPEPVAKENAETANIQFKSATEAVVQIPTASWRAVWEGDNWKLDSTDSLKKGFLQLTDSPQGRKRIEDY